MQDIQDLAAGDKARLRDVFHAPAAMASCPEHGMLVVILNDKIKVMYWFGCMKTIKQRILYNTAHDEVVIGKEIVP